MKNSFSAFGAISALAIVAIAVLIGVMIYKSSAVDKECKKFVDDVVVPQIIADWDNSEFNRHADYAALKKAGITDDAIYRILEWSQKRFGKMLEYKGSEGSVMVTDINGVESTRAHYVVRGIFEHGEALIELNLQRTGDKWKIAGFRVNAEAPEDDKN